MSVQTRLVGAARCGVCGRRGKHPKHASPSRRPQGRGADRAARRRAERAAMRPARPVAEGPGRAESRAADRDDRRRTRQRVLPRVLGYQFSTVTGAYTDARSVPGLATLERRVARTRQLRINRRFNHPAVLRARGRAQRALLADLREHGLLAGGDACLACHEDDDLVAQCSRARGHAGNHRADFADDSHAAWGDDAPGAIPDDLTQFVPFEVAA